MVERVVFDEPVGFVSVSSPGRAGMAILVWHDGQLMRSPLYSVATRICWPQVGQLNLNSVLADMASVFMGVIYPDPRAFGHWLTPGAGLSETLTLPTSGARCSEPMFSSPKQSPLESTCASSEPFWF